MLCVISIVLHR